MPSYNKVQLIGNLTRDPEVRYTPKGSAVCDIGLAINRTYTDEGGQKKEDVTFVDVTCWAKTAELVAQHCRKGQPLFVEGRLQTESWDDKQTGQKRTRLKVVAEGVQFLGSRGDSEKPAQTQRPQQRPAARQQDDSGPISDGMEDDDIPF